MSIFILFTTIFTSIIIRIIIVSHSLDVADIKLLYAMGEAVLQGLNPYLALSYNIYPPIALYMEAASIQLSQTLNVPFHIITRIWPNLADLLIALVLYKFLLNLKVKPLTASLWSAFFILNPLSIIISASHGQIDSIPSLLVLLAIYMLSLKTNKLSYNLAALCLGIAIAIKPNPVILLPFFLFFKPTSIKEKINFLLFCTAPTILTLLPFIRADLTQVLGKILSYSGVYDFSYAALLRGVWYEQNANIWLPLTQELLNASKLTFIIASLILFILYTKHTNLTKICLAIYLLFLGFYFGISAQYLVWILPLAIIDRSKMVFFYSFSVIIALLGFYLFFGPDILLGNFKQLEAFQSEFMLLYFTGNLLLWTTVLIWFAKYLGYIRCEC